MGNMRDAFKKAKILSDKDARRLAHEERVHRKSVGHKGLEEEQHEREAELRQTKASQQQQDRLRQADLEAQRKVAAEVASCEQILRNEARRLTGGAIQAHVLLEDQSLPRLSMSHQDRANLLAGHLCLVRLGPKGSYDLGFLQAQHAQRVGQVFPERVVWSRAGALPG